MIGQTLYKGKGKIIFNEMLEGGDGIDPPKIKLSLMGEGQMLNIPVGEVWTFIATVNADGLSTFAEGQGMIYSKDLENRALVVATAQGLGKPEKNNTGIFSRSQFFAFYHAKNPTARGPLRAVDNCIGMNIIETNEQTFEYTSYVREWKLPPLTEQ